MSGDGASFTWRDANRTVLFGQGAVEGAPGTLAEHGFEEFDLLSTPRAMAEANQLAAAAAAVHEVAPGGVPEAAAALLGHASSPALVALGGGRVIDAAKAVASVEGQTVAAIPTTLSGAEMTGVHRFPAGAEERAKGLVRPELVIADPEPMTSQPESQLRASAMNALAHGADSLYTPLANPVSRMIALRGAQLIGEALDQSPDDRDRSALALGAILCGYAFDSALFAIHHVICQTLVRELGVPHAETNAAILPHAIAFMRERAPVQIGDLANALHTDPDSLPDRIAELGRPLGLGDLSVDKEGLEKVLDEIEARPQLAFTPDPPDREQLRTIIEAAW
ncbi:MAG: iron-containing alcohol dehydrogenase [Actinomycetota bacterium]